MKPRTVILLVALGVMVSAGGMGLALLLVQSTQPPETPEQVVRRQFDCLKKLDMEGLQACYTEDAWKVLRGVFPIPDDKEGQKAVRERMGQIKAIRVRASRVNGDRAQIVVGIELPDGEDNETFQLVRTGEGWRIN